MLDLTEINYNHHVIHDFFSRVVNKRYFICKVRLNKTNKFSSGEFQLEGGCRSGIDARPCPAAAQNFGSFARRKRHVAAKLTGNCAVYPAPVADLLTIVSLCVEVGVSPATSSLGVS